MTNPKIEINKTGQYLITWCLWFKDNLLARRAYIGINGGINIGDFLYAQQEMYTSGISPVRLSASCILSLNASDYFELVAYADNATLVSSTSKSEFARLQITRI